MNSKGAIFLSAGIPATEGEVQQWEPNVLAIREAVLALVAVVVPKKPLVFGGHPAISPLVEHAARSLLATDNVSIYQSAWFADVIPPEAKAFENFHLTRSGVTREASLQAMRNIMLGSASFTAGVFIGGMQGILDEYEMFQLRWPNALTLPIASTGGAARMLFSVGSGPKDALSRDLLTSSKRYRELFRKLLENE